MLVIERKDFCEPWKCTRFILRKKTSVISIFLLIFSRSRFLLPVSLVNTTILLSVKRHKHYLASLWKKNFFNEHFSFFCVTLFSLRLIRKMYTAQSDLALFASSMGTNGLERWNSAHYCSSRTGALDRKSKDDQIVLEKFQNNALVKLESGQLKNIQQLTTNDFLISTKQSPQYSG